MEEYTGIFNFIAAALAALTACYTFFNDTIKSVIKRIAKRNRRLSRKKLTALENGVITQELDLDKLSIAVPLTASNEDKDFAATLVSPFKAQGWKGKLNEAAIKRSGASGLKIWCKRGQGIEENARRLGKALEEAGLDYGWEVHDPPAFRDTVLVVYGKP